MNSPSLPVIPLMTVTVRGIWTKPPVSHPVWQNYRLVHLHVYSMPSTRLIMYLLFLFLLLFRSSLIFPLSPPLLFLVFLPPLTPTRDQPQAAAGRPAGEGSAKPLHHETTVRGEDATLAASDTLSRVRERQSPKRDK